MRLGKGAPDVQQKGITGNTILFAQPTADVASMELPPAPDALVDSLNIAFSRSTRDLRKAEWATINVGCASFWEQNHRVTDLYGAAYYMEVPWMDLHGNHREIGCASCIGWGNA